jgi:hypothetical protein
MFVLVTNNLLDRRLTVKGVAVIFIFVLFTCRARVRAASQPSRILLSGTRLVINGDWKI